VKGCGFVFLVALRNYFLLGFDIHITVGWIHMRAGVQAFRMYIYNYQLKFHLTECGELKMTVIRD